MTSLLTAAEVRRVYCSTKKAHTFTLLAPSDPHCFPSADPQSVVAVHCQRLWSVTFSLASVSVRREPLASSVTTALLDSLVRNTVVRKRSLQIKGTLP